MKVRLSSTTQRSGFNVGAKQGRVDARLGYSNMQTDGENISRTGDEKDGYENSSLNFKAGLQVSDELRISVAARHSDGMNEFDADNDFDGFVEDQDSVSEFRNSTMRVQGDYSSADGRWQHKLMVAQSNNDNEAFANGTLGNVTASTKDQVQYIGSLFWNNAAFNGGNPSLRV